MFIEKVILWGAGTIGSRFINHLRDVEVIAYIDSDRDKIGRSWMDKPVISFEEYKEKYSDIYIIITGYYYEEIIEKLKRNGCNRFFWCMDCPGEWTDLDLRIGFEDLINKKIQLVRKPVVYGCNYYGMTLVRRIYEATGIIASLAYNNYTDEQVIDSLKNDFPEIKISTLNKLDYDEIIIAEDRRYGFDSERYEQYIKVMECWDASKEILSYHNEKIKKIKNIHSEQRCFVVGLGPSLRIDDLDVLHKKKEICFSVNEIWKFFDKTKWRPDYFVVTDTNGIVEDRENYVTVPAKGLFISDQTGKDDLRYYDKVVGEKLYRYHIQRSTSMELLPRFSDDCSVTTYYGYTVTYACIQFALYMGFKYIYLLGVDATGASLGYGMGIYKHAYKENKLKGRFFEPYNTHAYISAKSYAEKNGAIIYNATRGGELEVFERKNFDELFE